MGSCFLLQGIFPTQGLKPGLHVAGGFFTSWVTREAPKYWSGQPIPSPVDLPDPGIKPGFPALQLDSLPAEHCQVLNKIKVLCFCLVTKSCSTLCDLMVYSPPGSSVHGVLQARILEWVVILFSRGSSWPRDRTWVSLQVDFFSCWATSEALSGTETHSFFKAELHCVSLCPAKQFCCSITQSCLTLCDPMDYSPPGSSVHGVL